LHVVCHSGQVEKVVDCIGLEFRWVFEWPLIKMEIQIQMLFISSFFYMFIQP
jgi:hypothetical protein